MMLRTNLATRPFYNERAVHLLLGAIAFVSVVLLVVGGLRFRQLSTVHAALTVAAEHDEQRAREILQETEALQRETGTTQIDLLTAATGEVNQIISQRIFSWTEFLNLIEATLPVDVRLTSLRPGVDTGDVTVSIGVVGRSVGVIFDFIEQLEATGAFSDVLPVEEEMTEDGMYRTILVGRYVQVIRSSDETGAAPEGVMAVDPAR